jgi:hypothetical protein
MGDSKYNGWANYATWRSNLEICDDITSSLIGEQTFEDVDALADYLAEAVEDTITNYGELEGLAVDYARAFVADVDWYEIAGHYVDELIKPENSDDEDRAE